MERPWRQGRAIWRQINDHDEIEANTAIGPFGRNAFKHQEPEDMNPLAAVAQLRELNALYEHHWHEVDEEPLHDQVHLMPVHEEHEPEDDEDRSENDKIPSIRLLPINDLGLQAQQSAPESKRGLLRSGSFRTKLKRSSCTRWRRRRTCSRQTVDEVRVVRLERVLLRIVAAQRVALACIIMLSLAFAVVLAVAFIGNGVSKSKRLHYW